MPHAGLDSSVPLGAGVFDSEGRATTATSAARALFGEGEDDPLSDYLLFKDPSIAEETKQKLRRGQPSLVERWVDSQTIRQHPASPTESPADDPVCVQFCYVPYGPDALRPDGYIVTIKDLTAHKRSEKALQESERRLNEAQRLAHLGTWTWDIGSGSVEWSDEVYRIFRLDPDEFVPQIDSILKFSPWPEDSQRGAEIVRKATEDRGLGSYEQRFLRPDNSIGYYFSTFQGKYDDGGDLVAIVGTVLDITDRKEAEEATAAERERLAVTLRSIGDGVITTDTSGNIVIMNRVAERLCGWKQGEAQGRPLHSVFNIINKDSREPHDDPVAKVLASGEILELANETLLIARDGTERLIADSGAPIKDRDSKTVGVVLVFRDVTEKHRLLDNMQRIDRLESLGVLAGGIAHDFNNLLGGIFGYIEMARLGSDSGSAAAEYLDKALGVSERAKDLTQQLLTFSKGGAPTLSAGEIGRLIVDNVSFVLSGTNVDCDCRIPENLWLCDYDESQIGRVIDNIVINAREAMPDGGTVTVSAHNCALAEGEVPTLKPGDYVKISVTDTGKGIPHRLVEHIFDPFYTTKQGGNGLGLATCHSIAHRHNGYIAVESVPGEGSTFHIYLPASRGETIPEPLPSTSQHHGEGDMLVMDDEGYLREIVGHMLAAMGYGLIEAKNGEEALQLVVEARKQGRPIRGALFDLTVPGGMGGREAIAILRRDFPDMPVFASSGFSEDPTMARPAEFGFTDSIRKPFERSELAEMLNRHMGARK